MRLFLLRVNLYLKSFLFYFSFNLSCLINGREQVIKSISENISSDIRLFLDSEYFEDISYDDLLIISNMAFYILTLNFLFLKDEEGEIKRNVFENLDRKLKWMAKK